MKAAYLENDRIRVGELTDPVPGKGQALVRTHRCGLCASDAHFLTAGHHMVAKSKEFGGPYAGVDLSKPIVMGHEYRRRDRRLRPGQPPAAESRDQGDLRADHATGRT